MSRRSVAAIAVALSACATTEPARSVPDGWEASAPLAPIVDRDPDARVVEMDLVAAPMRWALGDGRVVDGMAYNGSVPGPLIEARVGDTLVVHFRNELDRATTIHWHGVRVPVEMDGGPHSQEPIPPGGTFEYRFELPDAGTYWYHPHALEAEPMERGLYGAIVVRGDEEPEVDTEAVLVLDDLTLDASGAIAPFGDILEIHGGREGDVQLVNGTIAPSVAVRAGERQRWRIVNAGSARFYRLALAGHRFTVIGGDEGLLAAPREVDELFLMPGDRADVLIDIAAEPGASAVLTNEVYARGHGSGVFAAYPVATLEVASDAALPLRAPHVHARAIDPLDVSGVTPREVRFDETLDSATETVTFTINNESYPDVTPIDARVGQVAVWDLINESEMDHPFHLHGFFFQVLERDGVAVTPDGWEDTIQLRGEERVRIAFRPDARPGMWMFHCHILEHIDHGMMGMMHVAP